MQNDYNDLKPIAEMMYPNPAVEELKAIADKMCLSERLVDMNQVMEITTLSRRTLLNLEASGEFPERVQVTEGRKAWYLSPRFYVSTSKSIIKALINMHSFEIQLSPIG